MSDGDALGRRLGELRDTIEPTDADLTERVRDGLTGHSPLRRQRLAVAAVSLLVAGVLVGLVPAARTAVASWLGIGNTRVDVVDELPDVTPTTFPSTPLTPDDVDAALQLDERLTGPIVSAYERDLGGGIVETVVVYGRFTLSSTPAASEITFIKSVGRATSVASTIVTDGEPALWIDGLHTRTIGATTELVDRNTLIWTRSGLEFRLVGGVDLDEAVEVARSMG